MSTQTATSQAASTATVSTEAVAQPQTVETSQSATPSVKKEKLTNRIVDTLKALNEGETLKISEISDRLPDVKKETLQATLSQLVGKRVEKVPNGTRQPGYKAINLNK